MYILLVQFYTNHSNTKYNLLYIHIKVGIKWVYYTLNQLYKQPCRCNPIPTFSQTRILKCFVLSNLSALNDHRLWTQRQASKEVTVDALAEEVDFA